MKREHPDGDDIDLRSIPDAHRHLIPRQSPFILKLLFRIANMSNRTSIKYPGTTTRTSKVHINNMYIKYTFDIASLLIHQVLGAVALPMTFSLAVETHSVRLRTSLGLHRSDNRLAAPSGS